MLPQIPSGEGRPGAVFRHAKSAGSLGEAGKRSGFEVVGPRDSDRSNLSEPLYSALTVGLAMAENADQVIWGPTFALNRSRRLRVALLAFVAIVLITAAGCSLEFRESGLYCYCIHDHESPVNPLRRAVTQRL